MAKEYWTVRESLEAAQAVRKRHPDWEFDICKLCGKWCVSDLGLGAFHPNCYVKPAAKKMRLNDQQSLGI
jgi:hypothetical protein